MRLVSQARQMLDGGRKARSVRDQRRDVAELDPWRGEIRNGPDERPELVQR
jgi:hypothetical protein